MYKEKFTQNLRSLLGEKTAKQIAKEMNMPQQTLNNYLLGKREIGLENLARIADYFDISIDYLIGRKDY